MLSLYLDGYSYEQAGERLSCDTKTVDNALQRVKRKVGADLESRARRSPEGSRAGEPAWLIAFREADLDAHGAGICPLHVCTFAPAFGSDASFARQPFRRDGPQGGGG